MTPETQKMPDMVRPRVAPETRRSIVIGTKISPREKIAWEALRKALGGGGPVAPRDSDALRFILIEAARARGIPWPDEETPPGPAGEKGGG